MFRRRSSGKRMFQSKQFSIQGLTAVTGPRPSATILHDDFLLNADVIMGTANPVQASLKRISVVGIDWYFDEIAYFSAGGTDGFPMLLNWIGIYKDTLDAAGAPDSSEVFLSLNQVNGTVNQTSFPERIIDRRQFTNFIAIGLPSALFPAGYLNPSLSAERRVRRRVSVTNRESLFVRQELTHPDMIDGQEITWQWSIYGVITYRVDL